ncbi:MAG TPA: D-glycero-beta-D-manno-heptose-7-phosphate kinase, partial [Rhodospirillaceae bacterium]|nr:D-glycero-beta-D-manno-heptose-7-phosphate kinase [Rhodospirillaceae bacterium]
MERFDAEKCLKNMTSARILVAGDIMLDRFVYGAVERISPESPVPVLSISRENSMLGGAGNTLANLAGLGVKPVALSVVGNDKEGSEIRKLAEALDINTAGLLIDDERPTIV